MSFVNVDTPLVPEDSGAVYHLICDGNRFYDLKGGGTHTCLAAKPVFNPKDTIHGTPNGFSVAGGVAANAFTYLTSHAINFAAATVFTVTCLVGSYPGADGGIIQTDDTTNGWGVDWQTGAARFFIRSATAPAVAQTASVAGLTNGMNVISGGFDGTKAVMKLNGARAVTQQAGSLGQSGGNVFLGRRSSGAGLATPIYEIYITKAAPSEALLSSHYRAIANAIGMAGAL